MRYKLICFVLGMLLLMQSASAVGEITNFIFNKPLPDFTAGEMVSSAFSFDYPNKSFIYPNQIDNAELVIVVNITSSDSDYPVWKGDFEMNGSMTVKRFLVVEDEYEFECVEDELDVYYPFGIVKIKDIPNGTYYCTNPDMLQMKLNSNSEAALSLRSNPGLWPGSYNYSIGLFHPKNFSEVLNLQIFSPVEGSLYLTRMIPINISMDHPVNFFKYSKHYSDNGGRFVTLCRNCNDYGFNKLKRKPFDEGFHNLVIMISSHGEKVYKSVNFTVDSRKPRIRKTYPKRGFADGYFELEFQEENPKSVFLNYGNDITGWRAAELDVGECYPKRRYTVCNVSVGLGDYT